MCNCPIDRSVVKWRVLRIYAGLECGCCRTGQLFVEYVAIRWSNNFCTKLRNRSIENNVQLAMYQENRTWNYIFLCSDAKVISFQLVLRCNTIGMMLHQPLNKKNTIKKNLHTQENELCLYRDHRRLGRCLDLKAWTELAFIPFESQTEWQGSQTKSLG